MFATLEAKLIGAGIGILMLASLVVWHKHAVSSAYKQGKADEAEHVKAKALELKSQVDALSSNISTLIRSQNDAENSRIHSSAGTLFVRGAGRAACSNSAGVSSGPRGPQPAGGKPDAPLARLSYPDGEQLIGMPFAPTVTGSEHADLNRAEVISWRSWYKQQSGAWAKIGKPEPKPHRFLGIKL